MAVPGAGLLALLRKRSEPEAPQVGVAATAHPSTAGGGGGVGGVSKFEARSSAVHALEHAVATGTVSEVSRSQAQGRHIPPGPSFTYDVDVHAPGEAQPQLPVTPVTLINTDYALHHWRQIAVSPGYICYGLKQGHIRVLSRHSAVRALLKGHSKPLTDLQFCPLPTLEANGASAHSSGVGAELAAPASEAVVASGGQDGQLFVWHLHLDEDAAAVRDSQQLRARFLSAAGPASEVLLSWHAPSGRVLATGVGGRVLLLSVPAPGAGPEQLEVKLDGDATPGVKVLPQWSGEEVTCLAFSPDGQLLAAGGAAGTVRVWRLQSSAPAGPGDGPMLVAAQSATVPVSAPGGSSSGPSDAALGSISWLPCAPGAGWVLLSGNHNNAALQLWHSTSPGGSWQLLQELHFQGKNGQQEFFNQVEAVPAQQLVVVADTARKAVYTVHYSGEGSVLRFDYVARFGVAVPILSFTAQLNPAGEDQGEGPVVELSCVQTTAVQQYNLDPALCYEAQQAAPEGAEKEEDHEARQRSSQWEQHARGMARLGIQPQPSAAVPMPSEALAGGGRSVGNRAAGAVTAAQHPPESVAAASEGNAGATATAGGQEEAAAGASTGAEAEAAPPPPMPEPSIEGLVPCLSSLPPPAAHTREDPELPRPQEASGEVTPDVCPSPPPTPTEQQRAADEAGADAAAAAAASAAAAPPPQPRLLTPSELLQSAGSSASASVAIEASSSQRGGPSPTPSPPQPRRVLQRPASASAVAAVAPELAPSEDTTSAAAAGEEEATAPAAAAPTAAAAQSQDGDAASAGVAAAVAEQMGGVHKKFVGHVSLMYRELLKAVRSELGAHAVAQQQASAQLLAAALEAQKQQIEAERAAVLGEERASIERLLTAISATLNRDLPAKLAEAVRGEVAGMAEGVAAAVAPVVQQALAASLPKELSASLKSAGLDKSLAPAVAAGLGKPLQDAFRTAFTKQIVPAFEAATQNMFQQMNTALAEGLQEHVQASKSSLSEPVQLASQLAASLSSAQALAASLSQGQQQLLRAQSMGSADARSPVPAPVDIRSELTPMLAAGQYEQAFTRALGLQDVATVGWLAGQVDVATVLGQEPCPLSQMVLLSLVQQLSADLSPPLGAKLAWIREAAMLLNPKDPVLARHLKPVLEGVYGALQAVAARLQGAEASSCRLAMHVVHSQLTS